ncbi:MAG: hypothetical protein WA738_18580 [Candidatus Angelobacter sp.]
MRTDICTLPNLRTLTTLLVTAFGLILLCQRAAAANGRAHSSAAQVGLHINVVIMPVVMPPNPRERHDRDDATVAFNLAPSTKNISVSEEMRPMRVEVDDRTTREEEVRILTVVEQ